MGTRTSTHKTHSLSSLACLFIALTGCSDAGIEYYPLTKGSWWYFRIETTILDEHHQQRLLVSNLGAGDKSGRKVAIQRQSGGREVYFARTSRGIERVGIREKINEAPRSDEPTLLIPARLASSENWVIPSRLRLIESRTFARQDKLRNRDFAVDLTMSVAATDETVEVPAGQFTNCIRLTGTGTRSVRTDRGNASADVDVEHQEWYAPGVGLVKVTRSETSDSPFLKAGHYVQELLQSEL